MPFRIDVTYFKCSDHDNPSFEPGGILKAERFKSVFTLLNMIKHMKLRGKQFCILQIPKKSSSYNHLYLHSLS